MLAVTALHHTKTIEIFLALVGQAYSYPYIDGGDLPLTFHLVTAIFVEIDEEWWLHPAHIPTGNTAMT